MMTDKRIALVTGASSGIGRAAALALLENGYHVVLAGRREEALRETVALGGTFGVYALPVVTDVCQPESVERLFATIKERYGRLDVLFNNAGVATHSYTCEELPLEQFEMVMRTNVTGSFLCAQQALRLMQTQTPKGGRIINNGSVSAQVPRPNAMAYTVSKHAVTGLTKSICLEYRHEGICCSQIDIGNAAVARTADVSKGSRLQPDGTRKPEAQIDVRNVAEAVVYLANLPLDVNVPFMTIMANAMPLMGRG